jgi:hypothetical protein
VVRELGEVRRQRSIAWGNCEDCRDERQSRGRGRGRFFQFSGGVQLNLAGGHGLSGLAAPVMPYAQSVGQFYHPAYAGWGMPGLLPDVTGYLGLNSGMLHGSPWAWNGGFQGGMVHPALAQQQYWAQIQHAQQVSWMQQQQMLALYQGGGAHAGLLPWGFSQGAFPAQGLMHSQHHFQQQLWMQQQAQLQWQVQQQQLLRQQDALIAYQQMVEASQRYQSVLSGGSLTVGMPGLGGRLF